MGKYRHVRTRSAVLTLSTLLLESRGQTSSALWSTMSIGVQVNLCNCHCLLGQSISSLPPRSPRAATRSRHHFSFNKALSVDTSHPSEISSLARQFSSREGIWDNGGGLSFGSGHRVDHYYSHGLYHIAHASGVQGGGVGVSGVNSVNSSINSSRTARSSVSEMDSVSEAEENNKLFENTQSSSIVETGEGDSVSGDNSTDQPSETTRLLHNNSSGSGTNLCQTPPPDGRPQATAEILNKKDSHAYHFKRKYNFRSDSVFSDVMPMPTSSSATEALKSPENLEKAGSLSSLKGQSSKWASLRKKIGRLNSSSSSEKHQMRALEQQAHTFQQHHQNQQNHPQQQTPQHKSTKERLEEKRSLLQRAKTLAILPVNRAKEEVVKKPKEMAKPPELFNVGGEMNMIPLELLIDINDLQLQQ